MRQLKEEMDRACVALASKFGKCAVFQLLITGNEMFLNLDGVQSDLLY
jgi:hypothetical protein